LEGERQVVFVAGEVGIGKTTLVEAFMAQAGSNGALWIGHGQCIEQYGAGEAYMPVLEALGRLCREPGGDQLIELLDQQAPTWLVQMPALLSATELEALQRKVAGATKERMLREMAEAVDASTAERPLVLTLEDLHWSDHSTLELLSTLARRRERTRLFIIGTYRPVDVIVREHPLKEIKQELVLHNQCEELPLAYLTEAAVGEYLAERFRKSPLPTELTRLIYQRTDGNPLSMVNAVDYVVGQELVVQTDGGWELKGADIQVGVPGTLRQMVEQQIERLRPAQRRVLEVASVAGAEFSAAAVAAGMEEEAVAVEEQCEELGRHGHFIQAKGIQEWPDGTLASQYRFVHALYREVLYERVAAARRVQLHRLIGTRLEAGYAEQAGEIAAELAVHFGRGRDTQRAVQYLGQAGENAARKSAHREVIAHLTKGIDLLKTLPDTPERARQELPLQLALGGPLIATTGYTTLETRAAFGRARELCQQVGETPQLFTALSGLQSFYLVRAEYQTARELAEQGLGLAQHSQNPTLLMAARLGMGTILVCSESSFLPSNIFSKVLLCPILSNTIPLPHKRLRIRESRASPLLPLPCGIWVIRTRRWK
jgi:predicted ATPase